MANASEVERDRNRGQGEQDNVHANSQFVAVVMCLFFRCYIKVLVEMTLFFWGEIKLHL